MLAHGLMNRMCSSKEKQTYIRERMAIKAQLLISTSVQSVELPFGGPFHLDRKLWVLLLAALLIQAFRFRHFLSTTSGVTIGFLIRKVIQRLLYCRHPTVATHNMWLKSLRSLRALHSDAPKRRSIANGFAILSQLTATSLRRLTRC